jgi:hypothetical protein
MTSLRDTVRAALPDKVLALMDKIEAHAGSQIKVELDPASSSASTVVWVHGAALRIPSSEAINPNEILHELCHIERYWVEGVPQFVPSNPDDQDRWQLTSACNNALEHLVIVPREKEYGFDSSSHWNDEARHHWSSYPWASITDPAYRRQNCLLLWLDAALVTDQGLIDNIQACLKKEHLLEEAERFRNRVLTSIKDKGRAVALLVKFFKLRRNDYRLMFLDPRAGKQWYKPLPLAT